MISNIIKTAAKMAVQNNTLINQIIIKTNITATRAMDIIAPIPSVNIFKINAQIFLSMFMLIFEIGFYSCLVKFVYKCFNFVVAKFTL